MESLYKRPLSSVCKYKSIQVDILQSPLPLPKIEKMKKTERFTKLLKKINELHHTLTEGKKLNRIYLTHACTAENSYRDNSVFYATWRGLADENKDYKEKIKKIELQNYRISRLKKMRLQSKN
jgi:hypothetical protein